MNLCHHNHPEICYEERDCPLCATLSNLEDSESDLLALQELYEELQYKADATQDKLDYLIDLVSKANPELLI